MVDLKPDQRVALETLAARRGQKGFSSIVSEAIEHFLSSEQEKEQTKQELLALRGSISAIDADNLRKNTRRIRKLWR